ncbi:sugar nucleotide-binding protein [Yoonia sp.]|uniref:sugar nucleotide-binding protein n=1 Tax=Yoonia sp. TaxID=2212373 RepID=UPI0039762CC9
MTRKWASLSTGSASTPAPPCPPPWPQATCRSPSAIAPEGRNFPHRIIELADELGELRVVTDEVGNPTFAPDLAQALAQLIETDAYGVYHLTNAGYASRLDLAREILRISGREDVPIEAITLDAFDRDSTPPRFAPLANTAAAALGIRLRPWQEALQAFLAST